MKVYLVYRTDHVDWDEYDSLVICARSNKQARDIAIEHRSGDFKESNTKAKVIKLDVAKVVHESFNAG